METHTEEDNLPDDFTHKLHERVRESSHELRKLIVSFAAGGVALIFVALTEKIEPVLTVQQKWVLGAGLISFGVSLLSGLLAWRYDSEKNYYWAHELNNKGDPKEPEYANKKKVFMKRGYKSVRTLILLFGTGVLFLSAYVILRLTS